LRRVFQEGIPGMKLDLPVHCCCIITVTTHISLFSACVRNNHYQVARSKFDLYHIMPNRR